MYQSIIADLDMQTGTFLRIKMIKIKKKSNELLKDLEKLTIFWGYYLIRKKIGKSVNYALR